jgi:hypothetical protein
MTVSRAPMQVREREQDRKNRDPNQARAIAIMRIG